MNNVIFNQLTFRNSLPIVFLCGTKYTYNNISDKRLILKNYLEENNLAKAIILEEHFTFRTATRKYLSYDDIYLTNLRDIELLTALYTDQVFIIHDSISTAAEIGLFASNLSLATRICVISPDEYNVEENKLSGFIKLAFFRKESMIKKIIYFPKTKVHSVSEIKHDYHTYFRNNILDASLIKNINNILSKRDNQEIDIKFTKSFYNNPSKQINEVSYTINVDDKKINIYVSAEVLKIQIFSLFNFTEFVSGLRKINVLDEVLTFVASYYKRVMKNTISELENQHLKNHSISVNIKNTHIEFYKSVAFVMYLIQALGCIKLPTENKYSGKKYLFATHEGFDGFFKEYESICKTMTKTAFSRIQGSAL